MTAVLGSMGGIEMLSSEFLLGLAARIRSSLEASSETYASQFAETPRYIDEGSRHDIPSAPRLLAKTAEGGAFYRKLFEFVEHGKMSVEDFCRRVGADPAACAALRSKKRPLPSRETVVAFALALELDVGQASELLAAAGYFFDEQEVYDLVILHCIEHGVFALHEVNEALSCFNLKPLKRGLSLPKA